MSARRMMRLSRTLMFIGSGVYIYRWAVVGMPPVDGSWLLLLSLVLMHLAALWHYRAHLAGGES